MTPRVFDHRLVRERRRRAARLGGASFLLDRAVDDLSDRLTPVLRRFDCAAVLFPPSPAVAAAVVAGAKAARVISVVAEARSQEVDRGAAGAQAPPCDVIVGDPETLPLADRSIDLAVSLLSLQVVNDLPGVLVQIRRALRPDGLCLAALLGGDTLTELRQAFAAAESEVEGGVSPRVAPFVGVRDLGALLQRAGFALPVTDVDRVTVRYASPFSLLEDLRRMGATNPLHERRRTPLRRRTLLRMAQIYAQRFADGDGRVRATFDIVWLSGWAPHPGQPKPLAPGSPAVPLGEVLGRRDTPRG